MKAQAWASLALGVVLAAVLTAVAGPARIAAALAAADWRLVALAAGGSALFFVLRGARWRLLLASAAPVSTRDAASITAIGWTANNVLPLRAGEAVRAGWMARRARTGLAAAAGSIAAERVLDLAALALAASLGLAWIAFAGTTALPPWLGALVAVAWLLPVASAALLVAIARLARRGARGPSWIRAGTDCLPALARNPPRLAATLALTVLIVAAQAAVQAALALAVLRHADPLQLLAVAPLFTLAAAIPLAPAQVGTYEAAFVACFALAGAAEGLVAAAVAMHLVALTASLVLGAFAWLLLLPGASAPHTVPASPPESAGEVAP